MQIKLDQYDRKLLVLLDRSSNLSLSDLSRELRLGRDLVKYRLERFLDKNIVSGFRAVIDPTRGYVIYKTFLKLKAIPKETDKLLNNLRMHPAIFWSALSDGSSDVFFTCLAETPSEFHRIQDEILKPFSPIIILGKEFAVNVKMSMFSRGYIKEHVRQKFLSGQDRLKREIDDLEYSVLSIVAENARLSDAEIARGCGCSPLQVRTRISNLESDGVITGYKVDINLPSLGRTFYKIRIFSPSLSRPDEDALEDFCYKSPDITYFIRQLGSCPVEISAEAESYEHLNTILRPLKEKFHSQISHIETLLVRKQSYKLGPWHRH